MAVVHNLDILFDTEKLKSSSAVFSSKVRNCAFQLYVEVRFELWKFNRF